MIRFGEFELDDERYTLARGGELVHVEPKVLEVIAYLARNRERIVSKQELLDSLWEEKFVSESALTRVIRDARKVLDDSSSDPTWIRTVYGRGFVFIGEIRPDDVPPEAGPEEPSDSGGHTIAVFPFADLSPEKDHDWFCEGLADELISRLTHVGSLQVLSRAASFAIRRDGSDPLEFGRSLGADSVLEGSLRAVSDRVRITVHLNDTERGTTRWSERYDRQIDDVFEIQDSIAEHVVESILGVLGDHERRELHLPRPAAIQAWEYYSRGRHYFYREAPHYLAMAVELFKKAIEIEPDYALAWAGLADLYSEFFLYIMGGDEIYRKRADEASLRAVELAPDQAETYSARGHALSTFGRYVEACREFETAIRINPRSFEVWYRYGRVKWAQGAMEDAERLLRKASTVQPDDFQTPALLTQVYRALDREDDRQHAARTTVERVRRYLRLWPEDTRALILGAQAMMVTGETEEAMEWAATASRLEPEDLCVLYNTACIRALAGDLDEALEFIERAVARGYAHRGWIEHDPDFVELRERPEFQRIVRSLPRL